MSFKPLVFLVGLVLTASLADAVGAAKIFRWVDEKGVTHYGETIPVEYKTQGGAEMNKQGVTLRKFDPALTAEQRKAAEEKAARDRDDKQRVTEQRRRDMALMNTYTSSKEIEDHRDRTMQLPMGVIRGLEPRLKKAQTRLSGLESQATAANEAGKPWHDGLEQDIADQRAEVDSIRADIARNQAQVDAIRARFDYDKKRYTELTQR
ncbi:MAG: DUF4124 domain-containing protein [Betaproteobacteria bacterium]